MNKWSESSKRKLETCHPDLQLLANTVLQIHDCTVVYGHRTKEEQNEAYKKGYSKLQWPKSKHNRYPSDAIDLGPYIPGKNLLYDREQTLYFAGIVMGVAYLLYKEGKISAPIRWGGDWDKDNDFKEHSFYDGIHFERVV